MPQNQNPRQFRSPNQPLWIIFGTALVGLGVSIAQSKHFYDLLSGTSGFKSYCNLGATMNCDVVATSRFAELVPGVPLSSAAAGWFLAVAVLALMSTGDGFRAAGSKAIRWLGAAGAAISAFYLVIMTAVIQTGCLMCLVVDASLIFIALVAWLRLPQEQVAFPTQKVVSVLGASVLVTVLALKGMDQLQARDLPVEAIINEAATSPVLSVGSGPEFPSIGPDNAPITIVEFSDFQCPFCARTAVSLKALASRYPGKVRIVLRNFPLNSECNRATQNAMHAQACEAARAAICANRQGRFEAMYEAIFGNQADLKPGKVLELGTSVGLDPGSLQGCMASPETASALSRDVEEGLQLGVQSTPTLFINGRRLSGGYPLPILIKIVDRLLQQK